MARDRVPRARLHISTSELLRTIGGLVLPRSASDDAEKIREFHRAFGEQVGARHVHAVYQARHAFYLLLKALDLPVGSEVVMTPIHIPEFVDMIHAAGLRPVFVDLKKENFSMDPEDLERRITRNTSAVLVTHLCGLVGDMDEILPIIEAHGLVLIEDCSQCFGGWYRNKQVGSFGRASVLSLSLLKLCSTLNGGVLCTDDGDLYEKIAAQAGTLAPPSSLSILSEALVNLTLDFATKELIFKWLTFEAVRLGQRAAAAMPALQRPAREEEPQPLSEAKMRGYPGRLAELGLSQLAQAEQRIQKNRELATFMREQIANRELLPRLEEGTKNVFWLFPVSVPDVQDLRTHLLDHGVDSTPFSLPLLTKRLGLRPELTTPNALTRWQSTLFVPLHESFGEETARQVVDAVNAYRPTSGRAHALH